MRIRHVAVAVSVLVLTAGCGAAGPRAPTGPGSGPAAPGAAGASAAAAGAPATSPAPRPVRMAYGFISTTVIPMWIALDQGIFTKYGLDVNTTLLQTSAQIAPAMAAGEVDVALTAGAGVVDIDLAGGDQVLIASLQNEMRFFVHGQPDVRRIEDLRGRQIGITRRGSGINLAAELVLARAGLEPGRDVALQELGTVQNAFAALSSGQVAAVVLRAPTTFLAERGGYPVLVDVKDLHVPYSQGALAVTRTTLAERYELVRDFMKAFVEALGLARRDPVLAKRLLAENTQTTDQEIIDRSYAMWIEDIDWTLEPATAPVQTVLDQRAPELPAARSAKPEDFVDTRIINELRASGFLAQALGTPTETAPAR